MPELRDLEPVGVGLRVTTSPTQTVFYIILVLLGIVGNATVVGVIGDSVFKDPSRGHNSDIILINMALSNLLVSVLRNVLLVISDLGMELNSSRDWCHVLMGVWVWLRSVNVWSTLFLSAFHFQTLRRVAPLPGTVHGPHRPPKTLLISLGLIWSLNLIYAIPAHIYSTNGNKNSTETLMVVSSTTRPLLGCVWNFPSSYDGLAYATTSMVIHEILPIILMAITNLGSLYTLYTHGRTRNPAHMTQDAPVIKRVPAERRAAKVILALIVLFIASWGTSIISINYFNYNRGSSAGFLLVIARFANTIFIAISPIVLAVGHRRLRAVIKSFLTH
ncbi:olfactory receptor class A-like protein 4 [Coregonus clupeaformis]|uniref:olfactory receptor class A-like protein 4 n=1 Tax=Coregonus clupeaformis TaxID=59861 RepID=UPI001BE03F69|nr:olfactory receptor class A-like protein 4 [Coregonus clupeaformis]